jgi:cytochrome c oxidase cbb3-type subunit 3
MSGQKSNASAATRARELFQQQCTSCHGPDGNGLREFGAPDLTDKEWLYGGSAAAIRAQIVNGRGGVMPSWKDRLDPDTIKALAIYVHALGGGEK